IELAVRQRRHDPLDEGSCLIFENTCWIAVLVSNYLASGNVPGAAVETGELHCNTVGECHVAIKPPHEHGVVRRYSIDQLVSGKCRWAPALMVPVAVTYPCAFGERSGIFAEAPAELSRAVGVAEPHADE